MHEQRCYSPLIVSLELSILFGGEVLVCCDAKADEAGDEAILVTVRGR